ncbi:ankyrin repeat-containing domain, PGG domain protein [Tanacetum coccineum]
MGWSGRRERFAPEMISLARGAQDKNARTTEKYTWTYKFCGSDTCLIALSEAKIQQMDVISFHRDGDVRYSITENGETALHIAASVKGPKHVGQFVYNLVHMMKKEDLEFVNKNHNTALYLAAAAGNLEVVKILVRKNLALMLIPGGKAAIEFTLLSSKSIRALNSIKPKAFISLKLETYNKLLIAWLELLLSFFKL